MSATSPLAPAAFPELKPIAGVRLASYAAGIRYRGRDDVMVAELAPGSTVAGVFTQSTDVRHLTARPRRVSRVEADRRSAPRLLCRRDPLPRARRRDGR